MSATKPLRENVPPEKVSGEIQNAHLQDELDETSSGEEFIDTIATHGNTKDVKCHLILPNKTEVIFQVDTGASVNVLPSKYHPADLPLTPVKKTLRAWSNNTITPMSSYRHSVRNPMNRRRYSIEFLVVKEDFTPILGLRSSQALNFITINENEFERVLQIDLDQHKEVFDSSVGSLLGQHNARSTHPPVSAPSTQGRVGQACVSQHNHTR